MPAENQTISIPAGDSRKIEIRVKDSAGVDVPLTGATVRWWAGKSVQSTGVDVHIQKTSDSGGGITLSGATATVTVESAETAAITPGTGYHEAEVAFADGTVSTVSSGEFIIRPTLIR
jgi:hypothetical protein